MKSRINLLLMLFVVSTLMITGCKDKETIAPKFDTLTEYMSANDLDLSNVLTYMGTTKFVAFPADEASIPAFLAKYDIIDIRSKAAFDAGHIEGAVNVAFTDILTATADATKPVLVVCFTGQTACYATALLRLYGHPDAQALKWGMSVWNGDEGRSDSWNGVVNDGDIAEGHNNWSYEAAPANVKFAAPVLEVAAVDGAAMLKERVEAVVAAGFKTVTGTDVITNPSNYFINNYFSGTDYTAFGHIAGAYRVNPLTLADDLVMNLDPNGKVVTYCYTGQTSALITAYLNVIGYEAYSLTFGMNGLYNSNSGWNTEGNSVNKWSAAKPKTWAVIDTPTK